MKFHHKPTPALWAEIMAERHNRIWGHARTSSIRTMKKWLKLYTMNDDTRQQLVDAMGKDKFFATLSDFIKNGSAVLKP